uniref:SWIM-type domain-containing protein n=2 Tax=Lactuca sativa TaxID=4236 RepID=A0A9R1V7L9_LACSA|nr:hypothetical protein LSAT_V11C600322670 [Lactuca sativa]
MVIAVSDVLISNMCEVFNGKIEKGRDKPIIGCLEYIREWNGGDKYQVTGALQDQHVVDVRNKTCTCRKWELIGIPCRHAIATLNEMSKDPEAELDIYKWVHKVYFLETWKKAYSFKVEPIKDLICWCIGVVRVTNKGQVGSQATTSKRKGKELKTQKVTCGWYIHASRSNPESDWFIRTLNQTHTCLQTRKLRACTASLISKKIFDQVEANPDIPLRAIQDHFQKTYQVGVTMDNVFRAKDKARKHITGDYTKQYEMLRDYVLELQATNLDTTMKTDVCSEPNPDSPTRQFRRIYVWLGPLKKGFKACLRDLLGFDGAFMKGPFLGQVLSAVGLDSNNGIYPLAYGIVESENTESWKWFLDNIGDDLDLGRNSNLTFISDRQKGLHTAVEQLFPNAEHRYCIRHIHDNMRKRWRKPEYRDHLWKCALATTIPEFEHLMKEFSQYDKEAC